jgi:uncharacterized membrane protein YdjX (TVP38/TMEM64 family)
MRLLLWFVGLMALILMIWAMWGGAWEARFDLEHSAETLGGAGPLGCLVAWALLVADVVLPVPGTVVMSAAGWVYGAMIGGTVAATGTFLAGLAGYGLGRLFGERGARLLLGEKDLARARSWFSRSGGWVVCLSRALPLLPEAVACTAGLVRMPFRRFCAALACGSVPMGFVFAAIGASGHDCPGLAIGLSLLLPVALWGGARLLSRRFERREENG